MSLYVEQDVKQFVKEGVGGFSVKACRQFVFRDDVFFINRTHQPDVNQIPVMCFSPFVVSGFHILVYFANLIKSFFTKALYVVQIFIQAHLKQVVAVQVKAGSVNSVEYLNGLG